MSSPSTPEIAHRRAKVAVLTRLRAANDPDLLDARQNLTVSTTVAYLRRTLAAAPPLTSEQRNRIVDAVFNGGGDTDAA